MSRSYRAFIGSTLLFVLVVFPPLLQAQAVAARAGAAVGSEVTTGRPQRVDLLVGRSTVVRMDRPIVRVSLSTADIADAMATSPNELLIHGKAPGTISLFVWTDGGRINTYDVSVRRDLGALEEQVHKLFPGEPITVASNGKDVVLSGVVSTKYVADRAASLAVGYVDKAENVVNLLRQQDGVATNQVLLQVRFAEVSRSAVQELGASFFTGANGKGDWVGRTATEQFAAPDFDQAKGLVFSDFLNIFAFNTKEQLGTLIRALQNKGLFQSLAEPNLITQDGKEASFLAGGEYPYPVVQAGNGNNSVTIVFKEFGVRLKFTPTILSDDMIHLKIAPEVSTLDFNNAVTISGFRIPALSTRRTDTEVELRDGQTFAVAGLLDNTLNQTLSKVPGIGDIPILGYLFRSRAYQKNATELVVMITPRIVHRNSPGVTPNLPGIVEPYLGNQKRIALPPPAFSSTQSQVNNEDPQPAQPAGVAVARQSEPAAASVATAAPAAVSAPTWTSNPSVNPTARAVAVAPATPAVSTAQPAATAAVDMSRTTADPKALERARARDLEQFRQQQKVAAAARQQQEARAKKDAAVAARAAAVQAQKDREQQAAASKLEAEQAARQGEIDRKRREDEQKQAARAKEMADQLAKNEAAQQAEQAKIDAKHQEEEQKLAEKKRIADEKLAKERQAQITRVMEQYSGK
jgi:pilus assembly protein CpaC